MSPSSLRARLGAAALLLLVPAAGAQDAPQSAPQDVRRSVVKVLTTQRLPDFLQPWTRQNPSEMSGSGVVIEGQRILTNAHVVGHASQIYVQPYQSSDKLAAELEFIAPGIDLALLRLRDERFFESHPPLPMAEGLPQSQDKVSAYGFPMGGTDLSITEGIVSRIEYAPYNFGTAGLRIQVDAALNPGNSGGPAVVDGKLIGLVFSGIPAGDNIGFLIPNEEIRYFLADVKDGSYEGNPRLFEQLQTLENDALRAKLGVDREVTGLVVTAPREEREDYPLKPWDILTAVGPHAIANDGKSFLRDNLRVSFHYHVPQLVRDGKLPLTVRRGGEELQVELPVTTELDLVVPDLGDEYPPYFIYGPLTFSSANQLLVRALMNSNVAQALISRGSPLLRRLNDVRAFPGEELVFVSSRFFPHPITKGYDDAQLAVLKSVNGVEIQNLAHLVTTLRGLEDRFVVFEFADDAQETLVFEREQLEAATEEILTDNGIRHQASETLRALWGQ